MLSQLLTGTGNHHTRISSLVLFLTHSGTDVQHNGTRIKFEQFELQTLHRVHYVMDISVQCFQRLLHRSRMPTSRMPTSHGCCQFGMPGMMVPRALGQTVNFYASSIGRCLQGSSQQLCKPIVCEQMSMEACSTQWPFHGRACVPALLVQVHSLHMWHRVDCPAKSLCSAMVTFEPTS